MQCDKIKCIKLFALKLNNEAKCIIVELWYKSIYFSGPILDLGLFGAFKVSDVQGLLFAKFLQLLGDVLHLLKTGISLSLPYNTTVE